MIFSLTILALLVASWIVFYRHSAWLRSEMTSLRATSNAALNAIKNDFAKLKSKK